MMAMFIGNEVTGVAGVSQLPETVKEGIKIPCHGELATVLLKGLVKRKFELSFGDGFNPMGGNKDSISQMVTSAVIKLTPEMNVPIIPIFINAHFPPLPSSKRCYDLGVAINEVLADRPERVAILASGGLSNDPLGRWVDQLLDQWVINSITSGDIASLRNLFSVDSQNLREGTGEIRAWTTVAAACGSPATSVDYIPARQAKTGLAFAYWPTQGK